MKKRTITSITFLLTVLCLIAVSVFAVGPITPPNISDWEATGFNNGRRICRDANGYFHMVYHSKAGPPSGAPGADIYYTYTMMPAAEPPSMASQGAWAPPVNMTQQLGNKDNRYPSIAIEYEDWDFNYQLYNTLHIVWQAILPGGIRYEVVHAAIPVMNPPMPPAPWALIQNLSNTPQTDSLVPAICINEYRNNPINPNFQNLHVVWQEEDINNNNGMIPPPQEDAWFSDIAYIYSPDSGINWFGPMGGWQGNIWDNISQTPANSQMPTIACILDQHTGIPHGFGINEFGYNSSVVHVAYNENTAAGINVYYVKSLNNGMAWNPRVNVSAQTGGVWDAYPNITVDMARPAVNTDNPYIVFMRNNMVRREPMRTGANQYTPGANPTLWNSFPGPQVGMYGAMTNSIVMAVSIGGGPFVMQGNWNNGRDQEFPTAAFDRMQNPSVNWQEYNGNDYEIMRDFCFNANPPMFLPIPPILVPWNGPVNDSQDPGSDDLFPNLAHRKAAMYVPGGAGYDEVWTKVLGIGSPQAINAPKVIMQDGNMTYGP